METRDPRVDNYIARSAPFARPILRRIRRVVHAACPGAAETIKWGVPFFEHKGTLCYMAAFKARCALGFWKQSLMIGSIRAAAQAGKRANRSGRSAMGQFGRIAAVADLPGGKTLARLVREAAALNEQGIKRPARTRKAKDRALPVPSWFMTALRRNRKALATFEGFSWSNRKDYVEWVSEAKREETRKRRLSTAIVWLAAGKPHNWKYIRR